MSKPEDSICAYVKRARELYEYEEKQAIGHAYSTMYGRIGCLDCDGTKDDNARGCRMYVRSVSL